MYFIMTTHKYDSPVAKNAKRVCLLKIPRDSLCDPHPRGLGNTLRFYCLGYFGEKFVKPRVEPESPRVPSLGAYYFVGLLLCFCLQKQGPCLTHVWTLRT